MELHALRIEPELDAKLEKREEPAPDGQRQIRGSPPNQRPPKLQSRSEREVRRAEVRQQVRDVSERQEEARGRRDCVPDVEAIEGGVRLKRRLPDECAKQKASVRLQAVA